MSTAHRAVPRLRKLAAPFLPHARNVMEEVRCAREAVAVPLDRPARVGVEELIDVRSVLRAIGHSFDDEGGSVVRVTRFRDASALRDALNARAIDLAVGAHKPEWSDFQLGLGTVTLRVMTSTAKPDIEARSVRWMHAAGTEAFTETAMVAAGQNAAASPADAESSDYITAMVEQGLRIALLRKTEQLVRGLQTRVDGLEVQTAGRCLIHLS